MLEIFNQIPTGSQVGHKRIITRQLRSVDITTAQPTGVLLIDGEIYSYANPLRVTVKPKHLRVFMPPECVALGVEAKNQLPTECLTDSRNAEVHSPSM